VEIGLCHLAPAIAHLDCALNVLVLARESAVALCLVQAIVVLVARIGKGPQFVFVEFCRIGREDGLVGGAVEAGVA
jgi:hypothetical protein